MSQVVEVQPTKAHRVQRSANPSSLKSVREAGLFMMHGSIGAGNHQKDSIVVLLEVDL